MYLAWKELRGEKGNLARRHAEMEMMRAEFAVAMARGGIVRIDCQNLLVFFESEIVTT